MNQNETRTLWISVGAALFAVFLLYSYTQEKSAQLTRKYGAKQRVVVATKDINEMQTVDETMVQVVEKPVDFIEPDAVSDPETAVGMITLAPIKRGEQILGTKLIKPGPLTGLALQVSPSKRAVALPVDDVHAVSKLIRPGDRIDILAAIDIGSGINQKHEVKTIMQDVTVLSTGLRIMNDLPVLLEKSGKAEYLRNLREDTGFNTITVEASPEQTQELVYLLSTSPGSIFVTLRHPSDHVKKPLTESTLDTLLGRVSKDMLNMRQRVPAAIPAPLPPVQHKKKKKGPFYDL